MPSPKSSARPATKPTANSRSRPTALPPKTEFEIVDPVWLVKALTLTIVAAIVCAWLAVCLLFYQGEWQLVLHPTHTIDRTPASASLPFQSIKFDAVETGQPRLTGWFLPADANARYAADTILYLHDGSQSLSATVPALARLHQAGLNAFAIDYRGFGQSDASAHPTEARMAEDSAAALDYLTSIRHISARTIIPYGSGLGASLAANLAQAHPEIPAVILDNPDPDPTATAVASHPSRLIPIRLLFSEHFEIAAPLATLSTPKLLIAGSPDPTPNPKLAAIQTLYQHAASPSVKVTLVPAHYDADYQAAIYRFLDQYLPPPAPR